MDDDRALEAPPPAPAPTRAARRETDAARRAYADYRDMEAPRSLAALLRRYQSDPTGAPTKRLTTLKTWSTTFNWQARIAAEQAQMEAWKRKAAAEVVEDKARQHAQRLELDGTAALMVAEAVLKEFVIQDGPDRGKLNPAMMARVSPRDVAPLLRVAVECLAAAHSLPDEAAAGLSREDLAEVLEASSEAERVQIVGGLRALLAVQKRLNREREGSVR